MKIGEVAARAGTPVETIRYYEREGLLPPPPRSASRYRVYGEAQLERLVFIRRCRSLDMTLGEIRALLQFRDEPRADCGDVDALLDRHVAHVADRIRALRRLEAQLKALRRQCGGAREAARCGILDGLSKSVTDVRPRGPRDAASDRRDPRDRDDERVVRSVRGAPGRNRTCI